MRRISWPGARQPAPRQWFALFLAVLGLIVAQACGGGGGGGAAGAPAASPTAPRITTATMVCPPDTPSFLLTVPGSNFNSSSVILVNGREFPTTFLGADHLSTFVNAQELASGGSIQVRNTAPARESSELKGVTSAGFKAGHLTPTVSPTQVVAGASAFRLAVWGLPVDDNSVIVWNGLSMPTTVDAPAGYAWTTIPASEVAKPGYAVVALYNRGGWITPAQIVNITINQQAAGIIESPDGGQLLGIVPDTSPTHAGQLIRIDPQTGVVSPLAALGKPTSMVAASDKGSLYLGSRWSSRVRRLAWPGLAETAAFDVPSSGVETLLAVPGAPGSILVGQTNLFGSQEVVIYDGGSGRANHGAVYGSLDCLAMDESGSRLYALDNGLSSFEMTAYSVDAGGLTLLGRPQALAVGFGTGLAAWGGRVYTSNGLVIDPSTYAALPKRIATASDAQFLLDPPNNRIYFAGSSGQYGTAYLMVYNLATLDQVGALVLHGVRNTPLRIVRWGRNGLAVVQSAAYGSDPSMYIFQTDLVRPF